MVWHVRKSDHAYYSLAPVPWVSRRSGTNQSLKQTNASDRVSLSVLGLRPTELYKPRGIKKKHAKEEVP
jgi:hypothetical protein